MKDFESRQRRAYATLAYCLGNGLAAKVQDLKNSTDVWKKLIQLYEQQNIMSMLNMQGEIATKELKEGESIALYLDRLETISRQLEAVGQNFSDIQYAYMLLRSLPSSYNPLVMTLQGRETNLTLCYISQLVL